MRHLWGDTTWQEQASCRDDPLDEVWFPDSDSQARATLPRARAICGTCPVYQACFDYAVPRSELMGVWAGLTEGQRKSERARRKRGVSRGLQLGILGA